MGWLWGSSPPVSTTPGPASSNATSQPSQSVPSSESTPPKAPSREELADREFASLLQEIEADLRPNSTKYNRVPKPSPPPTSNAYTSQSSSRDQSSSIERQLTLEEQLLPTSMSCRQKFDDAFYCQSFGGQFNNLYRYGGVRECGELWGDFWFCMKTRSQSGEAKDAMVRERYKRKALKYKVGPSSEDVWESRDKKLEWGEAFNETYEEPLGSDEEWQKMERMRRDGKVMGTT